MPDTVIVVPHPPAMKVGGRRRSVSSKHRTHNTGSAQTTEQAGSDEAGGGEAVTDDYPRPAHPGEGQVHQHEGHNQYQDEEQAKRDKKLSFNEKVKEYPHWKAESTRPTRDAQSNLAKVCGAGGRIAQPAGKGV
ncbi:hypothetical protein NP233_g4191 [Leucocoprinus birnbaumii]|uniref:Uncharacterized protein n=1 Tax=Leucocoprinus birnbaumii TaxID=56174 RepID=A0AAD5VV61_9AGAR|nr:hypothetical protein NP233_g4191 [Leucocoprinus birnbaumii]